MWEGPHTNVYTCPREHACTRVVRHICIHTHLYIHAFTHIHIHTHIHTLKMSYDRPCCDHLNGIHSTHTTHTHYTQTHTHTEREPPPAFLLPATHFIIKITLPLPCKN